MGTKNAGAKEAMAVPSPVAVLNNDAEDAKAITTKKLLTDLNTLSDLVVDFSSLKKCLNPMGLEVSDPQEKVKQLLKIFF